jgi:negative regulator of sigma E activity
MAQYSTKRKYTKKPTAQLKKVVKKVKKEVVDVVEAVQEAPQAVAADSVSLWQKVKGWFKSIVG